MKCQKLIFISFQLSNGEDMKIKVSLSASDYQTIKEQTRRGKGGEDVFYQLRILFCGSHDVCECDLWENCRDCVINNIEWSVKE